jgi:hypothetical protein
MATKKSGNASVHVGLVLAELICVSAFLFEIKRALGGNTLSWAYVFEWPILGAYAIYMWRKLLVHESESSPSVGVHEETAPEDDVKLRAWNDYLQQVHARDSNDQSKPPTS